MGVTLLKALLFVGGGAVAAAGTAYYTGLLDPWLGDKPPIVAAVPNAVPPAKEEAPAPAAKAEEPKPEAPASPEAAKTIVVPAFDIVRVEPDGSLVIAGRAAPNSTVEIVAGTEVLATTKADAGGDFVATLDDPLKPGDYQLVLRSTAPENVVATSTETAVVSVPDNADGQVLALVEEPGAPSRLITVPEAKPAPEGGEAQAAPAPQDEAAAQPDAEPADEAEGSEPATADETEPAAPSEPQIAATPQTEEPETAAPPADLSRVAVEAVEIEGGTVFVAGTAAAGGTVRVYANEILLGDARVEQGGRFLVEAKRDLPVGDYIIRADLLDADGSVLARAAVPFYREPGESIAAIAPGATSGRAPQANAAPEAQGTPPAPSQGQAAPETAGEPRPQDHPAASAPQGEPAAGGVSKTARLEGGEADEADVTAPKLQRVDGSVIIRRGDTLWHISRRVYGRGVRYSTIYLANQDQIRNPDRIWPGQVFTVPGETEEGERADMGAVADQAVPGAEGDTAPVSR